MLNNASHTAPSDRAALVAASTLSRVTTAGLSAGLTIGRGFHTFHTAYGLYQRRHRAELNIANFEATQELNHILGEIAQQAQEAEEGVALCLKAHQAQVAQAA